MLLLAINVIYHKKKIALLGGRGGGQKIQGGHKILKGERKCPHSPLRKNKNNMISFRS